MRAVLLHETGGPDVLRVEEIERPEPGEGEVLIRVHAASINPIEWKYRSGLMPKKVPSVLGSDISGTVEISRADGFAEGEEVFGLAASGAYAEFAAARAAMIASKPAGISHEQAAALPVAGMTAWQALFDRAALQRGQSALIAGASGGVGHMAVQFAKKLAGARTIGVGSSRNREFVLSLGADEYVDYTQQEVGEAVSGVDVAFDTVGGAMTRALLATVRPGGVLITIASAPPEDAALERGARADMLIMSPDSTQLARVGELVATGEVRVEIAEVFPLNEVPRAHALSESGHVRGKIVLEIGG
ncbi:MAG: Bifunctional protein: zinc-containing alcohol dehydrogenase [Solirubrobacterales bacterium]|nr:Bifunctional protein: zinc-containing alcohol dehydrogenase [Solirubrobacterales bacterium]